MSEYVKREMRTLRLGKEKKRLRKILRFGVNDLYELPLGCIY